jgi:hypothetical protein
MIQSMSKNIIVFYDVRSVYQVTRCHTPENRNDLVSEV